MSGNRKKHLVAHQIRVVVNLVAQSFTKFSRSLTKNQLKVKNTQQTLRCHPELVEGIAFFAVKKIKHVRKKTTLGKRFCNQARK